MGHAGRAATHATVSLVSPPAYLRCFHMTGCNGISGCTAFSGPQVISRYSVTEDRLIRWASMVLCNNFALNYEKLAAAEQAQGGAVTAEGGDGDHPCKAESSGAPQASHEAQFHIGKVCGGRVLYVSASFFNHSCW